MKNLEKLTEQIFNAKKCMVWLCPLDLSDVDLKPEFEKKIKLEDRHVTVAYGVPPEEWSEYDGLIFEITLLENCKNDRIQAISCEPHGIESKNANPHITISMISSAKPVESNDMLAGEYETIETINRRIEGILKIIPLR